VPGHGAYFPRLETSMWSADINPAPAMTRGTQTATMCHFTVDGRKTDYRAAVCVVVAAHTAEEMSDACLPAELGVSGSARSSCSSGRA
jgi:hypothetical protein